MSVMNKSKLLDVLVEKSAVVRFGEQVADILATRDVCKDKPAKPDIISDLEETYVQMSRSGGSCGIIGAEGGGHIIAPAIPSPQARSLARSENLGGLGASLGDLLLFSIPLARLHS